MSLRVLILGFGGVAQRHCRNLRTVLGTDAHLTACAGTGRALADAERALVDEAVAEPSRLTLTDFHVALVCLPTSLHVPWAARLAEAGVDLFIEKPLSHNLDGVDRLAQLCHHRGVTAFVAYPLRFQASLSRARELLQGGAIGELLYLRASVGQYLPDWRPTRDYRQTVSARAELGGGALLELSHELDYARWLAGDAELLAATTAQIGGLEVDVETLAELTLRFAGGAVGSVHLDLLQRVPRRTCELVGAEGTLLWDGISGQLLHGTPGSDWRELEPAGKYAGNDMYLAELRHFLDCRATGKPVRCALADAAATLRLALAARERAVPAGSSQNAE